MKKKGKMSFTNATEYILRESEKPLHYKEILETALKRKLIKTKGKTPQNTLASVIYLENKRRLERNITPRFKKIAEGVWDLQKRGK